MPVEYVRSGASMKSFQAGEGDDLVEVRLHLRVRAAEERAVEEDVLAAGELGFEAGAELEERRHRAAADRDAAARRDDARRDAQQRRLAGAVAADDAHRLAGRDGSVTSRKACTRESSSLRATLRTVNSLSERMRWSR
jgi:hypothetical protein